MAKDKPLTDPYGFLDFAIGSGDDFVCMDFYVDHDTGRVLLHSVVNSETGSFIQDFIKPEWYPIGMAVDAAQEMVYRALEWASCNNIRHSRRGWNQDPFYFVRCVNEAIRKTGKRVPRISKRKA